VVKENQAEPISRRNIIIFNEFGTGIECKNTNKSKKE